MRALITHGLLILIFTGFACSVFAEPQDSISLKSNSSGSSIFQGGKPPNISLRNFSLLDPNRFTMKQQSIVSYSSSGSYGSNLVGMYINTMEYRFNMPLTMRLKVAYQNNMGGLMGNNSSFGGRSNMETGNLFIPSFDMVYTPWKNTTISFHYRDYSNMSPYSGYGYNGYNRFNSPYMRY